MPRYRRHCPPNSVQHIISRFVNHEYRLDHPGARAEYLSRLGRAISKTDWKLLAYGLMSTHAHDALTAGEMPARRVFHPLNTGFAGWINAEQERLGPVFADRFKNITCDEERAAMLIAYIHNNPVRAMVVDSAEQSDWTSHLAYIGERPPSPWLDVERALALCGFDSSGSGRAAFHDFVISEADRDRDESLSAHGLDTMRARLRDRLGAPVELSSPTTSSADPNLRCRITNLNQLTLRPRSRVEVHEVIERVARNRALDPEALSQRTKRRDIVSARRLALLMWVGELGQPQQPMTVALGLTSSTGCHHLRRAETCQSLQLEAAALAGSLMREKRQATNGFRKDSAGSPQQDDTAIQSTPTKPITVSAGSGGAAPSPSRTSP